MANAFEPGLTSVAPQCPNGAGLGGPGRNRSILASRQT
jgi:hypothetical protein